MFKEELRNLKDLKEQEKQRVREEEMQELLAQTNDAINIGI
jgi:hypothetical protein